ncbi:MAG: epoxyqueuosine reductase QueH [Bacillota bacterium]
MLLHTCCGPCAVYPLEVLRQEPGIGELTGFFFNPNIQPYTEWKASRVCPGRRAEYDI